jgi:hypothetical protein
MVRHPFRKVSEHDTFQGDRGLFSRVISFFV